jgi:uncharacterized protein
MKEILTIPKEISEEYGPDYAALRTTGMQHIEKLTSKLWTDYNTHDPGITVLELLCWVITDLNYRSAMPIEDILASEKDNDKKMHGQFLSALNILPVAPVTADDYRKLFIRIEGVKNAWMQKAHHTVIADYKKQPPQLRYATPGEHAKANKEIEFELNGLYNVLLDVEEDYKAKLPEITKKVRSIYHHFRDLCEDLVKVDQVPTQEIVLCSEIELEPKADPELVWANIIYAIELYLSPEINFYSLQEMLDKGKPADEIFEGPVFDFDKVPLTGVETDDKKVFRKKGFIDDVEVKNSGLREQVRLSDLIRIIMKIPGVKLIKSIQFGFCGCDEKDIDKINQVMDTNQWLLCVKEGHKPILCLTNSVINFYKDIIPIELKQLEATIALQELKDAHKKDNESKIIEDLPIPLGDYRDIKNYSTMQNHLPETYGIGEIGLPETASVKRKALAKQLKAYLLFYDQVLADYFSQLANVKELLSANSEIKQTYFNNAVKGLKDDSEIFTNTANWEKSIDALMKEAKLDNYVERKNKFLDHLLARFAEQFNEYVFLLHRIYGNDFDNAIIRHKRNFYKDYTNMSAYRADALDYYNKKTADQLIVNVSGMEKRISRLLGFNHYKRQKLSQLHYDIVKVVPADPNSKWTWTITDLAAVDVLKGTGLSIKQVDAYEEMGLASILGCERENYITVLSADQLKVSFNIIDSNKQAIAFSATDFTVLPGEAVSGNFSNAETAITNLINYFLTDFRLEGMYVVEHMILRPDLDRTGVVLDSFMPVCIDVNGNHCKPLDPYSFRIAVILPGYSMRLRNKDFRRYAERLIRMETPAHILPRICFIGIEQMKEFEDLYELWLSTRINSADPEKQVPDALNKQFIDLLERLFTVYDQGQLSDCDDDTEEKNPVILGRTNLGSLKPISGDDA